MAISAFKICGTFDNCRSIATSCRFVNVKPAVYMHVLKATWTE